MAKQLMSKLNSNKRIEKEQTEKKSLKKILIWLGILGVFFIVLIMVSLVNRGDDYQSDYQAEYKIEPSENNTEVGIGENEEIDEGGIDLFDGPLMWLIWGLFAFMIMRKLWGREFW